MKVHALLVTRSAVIYGLILHRPWASWGFRPVDPSNRVLRVIPSQKGLVP